MVFVCQSILWNWINQVQKHEGNNFDIYSTFTNKCVFGECLMNNQWNLSWKINDVYNKMRHNMQKGCIVLYNWMNLVRLCMILVLLFSDAWFYPFGFSYHILPVGTGWSCSCWQLWHYSCLHKQISENGWWFNKQFMNG